LVVDAQLDEKPTTALGLPTTIDDFLLEEALETLFGLRVRDKTR
jgi:hypothetical protein